MSPHAEDPMETDDRLASGVDTKQSGDEDGNESDSPVELMVVSRARRSNAGNRLSTLLAAAEQEEEWGEDWEEAPNEEEFVGDDANEQEDYNMDSSSSEDEDEGGDEDAGEKELKRTERQEKTKKRKVGLGANPFAARLAASKKKVKLSSSASKDQPPSRPKKKSERTSWVPAPEDGPTRVSSRRQTVMNKEETLARLKEKDEKRADTLAMMKAAEERKQRERPKAMTQAQRLAEAARVEEENSKSLHRWEEAEEKRAAERKAKLDALKNRQMEGPFIRYYSGPAIWVDDKLKYVGKDIPKLDELEEELNGHLSSSKNNPEKTAEDDVANQAPTTRTTQDHPQPFRGPEIMQNPPTPLVSQTPSQMPSTVLSQPISQPPSVSQPFPQPPQVETSVSHDHQISTGTAQPELPPREAVTDSHTMPYPSSILFAPPQTSDSFLLGIEQYAAMQNESSQQAHKSSSYPNSTVHTEQPHDQNSGAASASQPSSSYNNLNFLTGKPTSPVNGVYSASHDASPSLGYNLLTGQPLNQALVQHTSMPHSTLGSPTGQPPGQQNGPSPQISGLHPDSSLQNGNPSNLGCGDVSTPRTSLAQPSSALQAGHSSTPINGLPSAGPTPPPNHQNPGIAIPPSPSQSLHNQFNGVTTAAATAPGVQGSQAQYPVFPELPEEAPLESARDLLSAFQRPPPAPAPLPPPKRKTISRAARNLVILYAFPQLKDDDAMKAQKAAAPTSARALARAGHQTFDRSQLIKLTSILFSWSKEDAARFVDLLASSSNAAASHPVSSRSKAHQNQHTGLPVAHRPICEISRVKARYRDPWTGLAYRDARAFSVLRGIVAGGIRWCAELGCFVGGDGEIQNTVGFGDGAVVLKNALLGGVGVKPARGVPARFLKMPDGDKGNNGREKDPDREKEKEQPDVEMKDADDGPHNIPGAVKTESVAVTAS